MERFRNAFNMAKSLPDAQAEPALRELLKEYPALPAAEEGGLRSALGPAPESAPTSHAHGGETGELLSALTLCGGDVGEAAKKLGVSRATLYRHIKRCGIDVKSLR